MNLHRLAPAAALAVALGCAHVPERPFQLGLCRDRGGQACHDAAKAELAADDAAGRVAAATFLMTACESGRGDACAELADLYHAGSGVPHDEAEACRLGRAASCGAVADAPPSGPRVPKLADWKFGAARDDLSAYEVVGRTYPEAWREPLGLTRSALQRRPPAPQQERELMDVVSGPRLRAAEVCLPVLVDGTARVRASAVASFTVGRDGRPSELAVRARPDGHRWAAEWERCIAEVIAPWRLPDYPSGGRFWFDLDAAGPERTDEALRETSGPPTFARQGYTKPMMATAACVQSSVRLKSAPPEGVVNFMFAVRADGRPDLFEVMTPGVSAGLADAVWSAVRECKWIPGSDPEGRPVDLWVVLPLRFTGPRPF